MPGWRLQQETRPTSIRNTVSPNGKHVEETERDGKHVAIDVVNDDSYQEEA